MQKYGFYDRLTEGFPSQIIIDLCNVCNYNCIHCPQGQLKKSEGFTRSFLPEELNKKLVDEAANNGKGMVQHIRYTADGEPLLHPEAIKLLRYAVEHANTMVSLTTNGSLLTSEMMDELLDMNIGLIDFSLDAFDDETYSQIRRNGNLKIVRENVLEMIKRKVMKKSKTRIVVSFVEQEKNTAEKDAFKKYWEENGVDYVVIRKLHSAGGVLYTEKETKGTQPCVYPWERITLLPDGALTYCSSWFGDHLLKENYWESSLKDVWIGDEYKQLREEHLADCFQHHTACITCPDRKLTIWPANRTETIRGYGDMIKDFSREENA